jgi:putative flippase GtrA
MKFKAVSFALVGVVNTFIDFGVFSFAWMFFGLSPLLANVVAWFLAASCSYFLNCFTTFAAESKRKVALRTYAGFIGASVAGLTLGTAILLVAKMFVPVLAAKLLATLASFALNFSVSYFVIFVRKIEVF